MTLSFMLTALVICLGCGTGALVTIGAALGRGAVFVASFAALGARPGLETR